MPYPAVASRRIAYDIDGTVVGSSTNTTFPQVWEDSISVGELNGTGNSNVINRRRTVWFFFPEKTEIGAYFAGGIKAYVYSVFKVASIVGSNDTTNGQDGTWETATISNSGVQDPSSISWRTSVGIVSFSEPKRCIKLTLSDSANDIIWKTIHFYGRKAYGETPDDILICNTDGNELTALMDWGDRPEATEQIKSIKLKNASPTKTANGVNLQLNHADFGLSFNVAGSWTATLDIPNIPPNSLSEPIYIKNTVGLPPQILGPKAGRLIVGVGSWT